MADAASDLGGGTGLLLAFDPFHRFTYLQPFFLVLLVGLSKFFIIIWSWVFVVQVQVG